MDCFFGGGLLCLVFVLVVFFVVDVNIAKPSLHVQLVISHGSSQESRLSLHTCTPP